MMKHLNSPRFVFNLVTITFGVGSVVWFITQHEPTGEVVFFSVFLALVITLFNFGGLWAKTWKERF